MPVCWHTSGRNSEGQEEDTPHLSADLSSQPFNTFKAFSDFCSSQSNVVGIFQAFFSDPEIEVRHFLNK